MTRLADPARGRPLTIADTLRTPAGSATAASGASTALLCAVLVTVYGFAAAQGAAWFWAAAVAWAGCLLWLFIVLLVRALRGDLHAWLACALAVFTAAAVAAQWLRIRLPVPGASVGTYNQLLQTASLGRVIAAGLAAVAGGAGAAIAAWWTARGGDPDHAWLRVLTRIAATWTLMGLAVFEFAIFLGNRSEWQAATGTRLLAATLLAAVATVVLLGVLWALAVARARGVVIALLVAAAVMAVGTPLVGAVSGAAAGPFGGMIYYVFAGSVVAVVLTLLLAPGAYWASYGPAARHEDHPSGIESAGP